MADASSRDLKIVRGATSMDCGGKCPLKIHVENGVIRRIEGDDSQDAVQLRACLRCRAYRQVVYSPDRIRYPMKRTGERGEGKFERISWDEALDKVAAELTRVKEAYGNQAILLVLSAGNIGSIGSSSAAFARLMSMFGGYTTHYGNVSSEGAVFAVRAQYGDFACGNSREELLNSKLIILWGWDPAKMIFGTNTAYHLALAKEAGARIVAVDPKLNETAAAYADRWIPIRPGTDAAMIAAMANVMIKENLHDRRFLDTYTHGFDRYENYVLGTEDGIEKTPRWAERITGVPAGAIAELAREYAAARPAAVMDGLGPARSAAGEQFTRAAMTLAAMGGNVGIRGGSAGGGLQRIPLGEMFRNPVIPQSKNPVEAGAPSVRGSFDLNLRLARRMHSNRIWDAILEGKAGGYPADIKMAVFCGSNALNQWCNTNKGVAAMKKLEFVLVPEIFITATARFADIVLPVPSHLERDDLSRPWPSGPYFLHGSKAVDPMYESKTDYRICCELAPRLGIKDYGGMTGEEWLKAFVAHAPDMAGEIKDYDKFKKEGIHRISLAEPVIAFKKQIEDPENNPFPTPSGKIEIYSDKIAELNSPMLPPIPKYVETWEGPGDPLAEKYPLQLITDHCGRRVHSQFDNVPWLKEIETQAVWMNPRDAGDRGIKNGDMVAVFNDRGKMIIPARVTGRIMPGVVSVKEGAWYDPDENGTDRGGCANVLTKDEYSPGGAFTANTCLVQAEKA